MAAPAASGRQLSQGPAPLTKQKWRHGSAQWRRRSSGGDVSRGVRGGVGRGMLVVCWRMPAPHLLLLPCRIYAHASLA